MNCPFNPIELLITEKNKLSVDPVNFKFCINKIKANDSAFQTWLLQKLDKDSMRIAKPLPFVAEILNLSVKEAHIIIFAAKISNPNKFKVYEKSNELPPVNFYDFKVSVEMRKKLYDVEEKIRERSLKDNLWPFMSCKD